MIAARPQASSTSSSRRALGRCAGPLWPPEDALRPLRALGRQGRVGGPVPNAGSGRRSTRAGAGRLLLREGAPLRLGRPGERPSHQALAGRAHDQDPCAHGSALPTARLSDHGRAGCGLHGRRAAPRAPARLPSSAWRHRLRQRRDPSAGGGARDRAQYPAQSQPGLEAVLLACALSSVQPNRAHGLSLVAPSLGDGSRERLGANDRAGVGLAALSSHAL